MASKKSAPKQTAEVTVTLAHPLSAHYAAGLGLEARDYDVEEDVKMQRANARALAGAGYIVDVDPTDIEAVNDVLGIGSEVQPSAGTEGTTQSQSSK